MHTHMHALYRSVKILTLFHPAYRGGIPMNQALNKTEVDQMFSFTSCIHNMHTPY
jgi:hypothetical protein